MKKPSRVRRNTLFGAIAAVAITAGVVMVGPPEPMPESMVALSGQLLTDGFEAQGGAGPPIDPCPAGDPLIAPAGWSLLEKSWVAAFSNPSGTPQATYPNSVGNPVPVPGYAVWRRGGNSTYFKKGQAVAIPFVALADTSVDITWDTAQSGPNYTQPRPADSMTVRISPCKWDFRPDPKCSRTSGMDSLFYTTREASGPACRVTEGGLYYINVVMADPAGGLTPGEHTCSTTAPNSADGCDIQVRHTGS